MQRIHFSSDDLARVRLVDGAHPMWEMLSSASLLAGTDGTLMFSEWRRRTRRFTQDFEVLRHLAPGQGYMADFLTPSHSHGDLESGIDAMLSTPVRRLRIDVARVAAERPLPGWARLLADGDIATLQELEREVRAHYHAAVQPHREQIQKQVQAARSRRAQTLASEGVEALLATLHPRLSWESPVLSIDYSSPRVPDRDVHLDGRGLLIVSSFFCWPDPLTLRDPELPPTLVLPIQHELGWATFSDAGAQARGRSLAALLGQTRAAVLMSLSQDQGCSTTQLARRAATSTPSASQRMAVLRQAGLATSGCYGKEVLHRLTSVGVALLNSAGHNP